MIDNTWAWGASGSFGLPGQQLKYMIEVFNHDFGCGSSTFTVNVAAPNGFSVSTPATTVTLKSSGSMSFSTFITSPASIADGVNPVTVTVTRTGTSDTGSATSYYHVYSSDTVAPTFYWPSVADGQTITGSSFQVGVMSADDHMVKKIELYIDNVLRSTQVCDGTWYACQLSYPWSLRGATGQHAVTFKSSDWLGNVGVLTAQVTVS
jgi:hypothetical protein